MSKAKYKLLLVLLLCFLLFERVFSSFYWKNLNSLDMIGDLGTSWNKPSMVVVLEWTYDRSVLQIYSTVECSVSISTS